MRCGLAAFVRCLVIGCCLIGLLGCGGGGASPPPSLDTEEEVKKATLEAAAPPGMSEDIKKMYEGGEAGYEAMQKMYQSQSMMPQGYPTKQRKKR